MTQKQAGQGQTGKQSDEWLQKTTVTKDKSGVLRVRFRTSDDEPLSQKDLNLILKAIRVEYRKYRAEQIVRHRKKEHSNGEGK